MDNTEEDEEKSKSQLKREMTALQELGEKLTQMHDRDLDRVPLDEDLKAKIIETRSIHKREGRRRHLQYIGKLMRSVDAEPIVEAIERMEAGNRAEARRFHALEGLRDKLLADTSQDAQEKVLQQWPHADRQHLRQLVRNAQIEKAADKPPASARKLFRYLREMAEKN